VSGSFNLGGRTIHRNPFEVPVRFEADELCRLREMAEQRQRPKDQNRDLVKDKRIGSLDNVTMHLIGLLGERAISRLLSLEIDQHDGLSGDRGKDFALHGTRIEVKTRQGLLVFKSLEEFAADIAVLVIHKPGCIEEVSVQGWIPRREFLAGHFIANWGYGDRPCIQPSALHPISTLKTYCLMLSHLRWAARR
jgi:hypothetical protein